MALIIQKYGGTSVGNLERIQQVAEKVIAAKQQGHDIIVVLSAMTGETDRLIQLAKALHSRPNPREYDALVSTGEQVTIALLSIALQARGVEARSYTGWQAGIETCSTHKKARINKICHEGIKQDLLQGRIPVIAGFQGIDSLRNITTLGRGGSDTTAVALAAAFKAECQIFTDVDGVYTTDPRVVPEARRLAVMTFEEMLELASLGAKVLQIRAVEFASKYSVPIRVLSTFSDGPGTLITVEDSSMEQALISGIAFDRNQAKITLLGIPDKPGVARHILGAVSQNNIDVDMIVQNVPGNAQTTDFSFTTQRDDYPAALDILKGVALELGARDVLGDDKVAKLSIVGVGMRSHAGVATTMFQALEEEGINIQLISTSEIKISVVVHEQHLESGIRCLHSAFSLHIEP